MRSFRALVAPLAVATVLLAACGGGSPAGAGGQNSPTQTVMIGELAHLTGASAGTFGIPFDAGLRLGVDQINQSGVLGGTKLALTSKDVAGEVAPAVTGFNEFRRRGIDIMVSPNQTAVARAITPMATKDGVFFLTGATVDEVVDTTFGLSDVVTPNVTMGKLVGQQGKKRVIALKDGDNPGFDLIVNGFRTGLEQAGGSLVDTITVAESDSDLSSVIAKIKSEKPDAVFTGLLSVQSGNLLSQISQSGGLGDGIEVLGNSSWQIDVYRTAGKTAVGVPFPTYWSPGEGGAGEFTDLYKKATGKTPVTYNAIGYEAAWLVASAVRSLQTSGEKINGVSMSKTFLTASASDLMRQRGSVPGFTLTAGGVPEYPGAVSMFDDGGNIVAATGIGGGR